MSVQPTRNGFGSRTTRKGLWRCDAVLANGNPIAILSCGVNRPRYGKAPSIDPVHHSFRYMSAGKLLKPLPLRKVFGKQLFPVVSQGPCQKMKPSEALAAHRNEIREIVLAHRAANARVFGSVVHGSDTDESDLDILVDTRPDTTLLDLGAIRYKLRNLLGVQVDVLTPGALPDKFRHIVISEARPV